MSTDKYLIIPTYPFDKTVFIKCTKCDSSVQLFPDIQDELNSGNGLGHPCKECGIRYALAACPNCQEFSCIDENEWNNLREGRHYTCNECNYTSHLLTHTIKLKTQELKQTNALVTWSRTKEKLSYMEFLTKSFTDRKQDSIAQKHAAIGNRLSSARNNLSKLQSSGIGSLGAYNNPDLIDKSQHEKYPVEDIAFSVSNAMISSLEILTQECAEVLDIQWSENNIGFPRLNKKKKFQENHPIIQEAFDNFRDANTEYAYLSKLRNCLHHRWNIPTSITLNSILTFPGPINMSQFGNKPRVLLPDSPDVHFGDITFNQELEIFTTLNKILIEIEKFIIYIYSLLPESKRKHIKEIN